MAKTNWRSGRESTSFYYGTGKEKPDERQMLMNLAARSGGKFNRVEARRRNQ
jgi:hypothetical protein